MASVTGYTAARMKEIEDTSIIDGSVVGDNLILEARDGSTIDAGSVRGPQGLPGTNGTNGTNGATGPAGPTTLIGNPIALTDQPAQMLVSGPISGLVRNNVPMVIAHTYGFKIDFSLEWASVDTDARWDIWLRQNGVQLERFVAIQPITLGTSLQPVRGEVFFNAPATQSTDDWDIYATRAFAGANITPAGSATLKRKFWIVDYGVVS